jgi:hypothetical protein
MLIIKYPPSTPVHQILSSRSMPEFLQFCAVPTFDWQTPNHTTEMAEHSITPEMAVLFMAVLFFSSMTELGDALWQPQRPACS